jgi:hypothetical protein
VIRRAVVFIYENWICSAKMKASGTRVRSEVASNQTEVHGFEARPD